MDSNTPLDYAHFQLSPKRSRYELFVSAKGRTKQIASGLLEPLTPYLKAADAREGPMIRLEANRRHRDADSWFTTATVERFVRFVGTPNLLERVNTLDTEMSQLERSREIYSQGAEGRHSSGFGETKATTSTTVGITKRELLRAIDLRLVAVKQDLTSALSQALSAGYSYETVSDLHLFAQHFGTSLLSEACTKFLSLRSRRFELMMSSHQSQPPSQKDAVKDEDDLSDMSIDDPTGSDMSTDDPSSPPVNPAPQPSPVQDDPAAALPLRSKKPSQPVSGSKLLGVLDRISLFESKQHQEETPNPAIKVRRAELRRLHSDISEDKSSRRTNASVDLGRSSKDIGSPTAATATATATNPTSIPSLKHLAAAEQGGKKDPPRLRSHHRRSFSTDTGVSSLKGKLSSPTQFKGGRRALSGIAEGVSPKDRPLAQWRTSPAILEEASRSHRVVGTSEEQDSCGVVEEMMLHQQASSSTQVSQFQACREERQSGGVSHAEQAQTVRPSKGSQQLNDELRIKADELEKIFAAHKLRVYREETAASLQSSGPATPQVDRDPVAWERRRAEVPDENLPEGNTVRKGESTDEDSDGDLMLQMINNQNYVHDAMHMIANFRQSKDRRGEFYEIYMEKRDAKLREEWGSKRVQKEANLRAMQDSLDKTQAEMQAQFARSCNAKDAASQTHRQLQRTRSFSAHSALERKEQTVEYLPSKEEEAIQELSEHLQHVRQKSYGDTQFSDSDSTSMNSSKLFSRRNLSSSSTRTSVAPTLRRSVPWPQTMESLQNQEEELQVSADRLQLSRNQSYGGAAYRNGSFKSIDSTKLLSSRSVSSSTRQTSLAPLPRSAVKSTGFGPVRNRSQPDDPPTQSVPDDNDFRKENKKPSSGISKMNSPAQVRRHARSKSNAGEMNIVMEEKPRRSSSMRKSSAGPGELKDLSSLNSNSTYLRSGESKRFLRKGNGIGPGSGAGIAKQKSSMASEVLRNGDESRALMNTLKDSPDMVVDNDGDSNRIPFSSTAAGYPAHSNNVVLISSQGARKFSDPLLDDRDVKEWPGESHASWNMPNHSSLSFAYEASTTDASIDSPAGSPVSWSSHPLNQMRQADSVRSRKRWGNAQNPFALSDVSYQAPKDATKGFKQLLSFGRKKRGTESIATDLVHASTASVFDTEDVYGLRDWSSEDPRMLKPDYPPGYYDGSNPSRIFPEKEPRSLFSIPSLHRRGSESKHR